jgi:putative ABC transport system permease protein
MLRTLFSVALMAYPGEFRREYTSQLFLDLDDRGGESGYTLRLFFDVLLAGIGMRFELLWRDIGYALRTLRKAPLFTGVVVGTLAIAIAANAIVFGGLYAVLIAPFSFGNMDRLALISGHMNIGPSAGITSEIPLSFVKKHPQTATIESIAGAGVSLVHARVDGRYVDLREAMVTPSYFSTLGIAPYIGRFFSTAASSRSSAVISYEYWRAHYSGHASVIGKQTNIDSTTYTIVGVAPPGTEDPMYGDLKSPDVWTLYPPETADTQYMTFPIVRMRPGVSIGQLQADVKRLWQTGAARDPFANPRFLTLQVQSLREAILTDSTGALWILFGAVAAVLLLACANVANLMLARGASRNNEFAVRSALGASAGKVASQIAVETLVLCASGCALGLAATALLMKPALALIPGRIPRLQSAHVDATLVLYVCALCVVVTLLAGLLPALRMKPVSKKASRIRIGLVSVEIGIAFALLTCAGLLLRSYISMVSQDVGFDPHGVYVATFRLQTPGGAAHVIAPRDPMLSAHIEQSIRALPNVKEAALATQVPFDNGPNMMLGDVWIAGQPRPQPGRFSQAHVATAAVIGPEFVPVMRIPILQGRNFTRGDNAGSAHQSPTGVLVNETFVREFLGTRPPLKNRIQGAGGTAPIIGVVRDVRNSLTQAPRPLIYLPFVQSFSFQVVMRTAGNDPNLGAQIAAIAHKYDPQIGKPPLVSMEQAIRDSASAAHAAFILLAALAIVALVLALAGIYGIVAFSIERRYHEIGVRLALGATNADIFRRTVASAIAQSLLGIAGGVVVAAIAANAIQTQLFRVSALDPFTFIATVALLIACTAIAAAVPAWRAMRIDPARTLRYE